MSAAHMSALTLALLLCGVVVLVCALDYKSDGFYMIPPPHHRTHTHTHTPPQPLFLVFIVPLIHAVCMLEDKFCVL